MRRRGKEHGLKPDADFEELARFWDAGAGIRYNYTVPASTPLRDVESSALDMEAIGASHLDELVPRIAMWDEHSGYAEDDLVNTFSVAVEDGEYYGSWGNPAEYELDENARSDIGEAVSYSLDTHEQDIETIVAEHQESGSELSADTVRRYLSESVVSGGGGKEPWMTRVDAFVHDGKFSFLRERTFGSIPRPRGEKLIGWD